jgi:hypothetical protein
MVESPVPSGRIAMMVSSGCCGVDDAEIDETLQLSMKKS